MNDLKPGYYWVSYKGGKPKIFERDEFGWSAMGIETEPSLHDYEILGKVTDWSPKKGSKKSTDSKSLHNEYVAAWKDFYLRTNDILPRFGALDGKMIKEIRTYLEKVSDSPDQALATWQAILENYHRLEDFFRLNTDLKFINSQINKIITQLKHVTGKAKKGHNATDLRGQL